MNCKKVNENGSLKEKHIEKLIADNTSTEMIYRQACILKARYLELKHLDETDPEPWHVYTAYDFFTSEEKQQFNPDGSLKAEYVKSALKQGTSQGWLEEMERRKKIEVDNYNQVSAHKAEMGINFGEQEINRKLAASRTYVQRRKQMEIDLRNFEDSDSLPFDNDTPF